MKVFVTGVNGQLGYDAACRLRSRGHSVIGSGSSPQESHASVAGVYKYIRLDIRDEKAVKETLECIHPDAIIHCAAWTDVDAAENQKNRPIVKAINADGTRFIAEAAHLVNAKMMYISTDYVFDGKGDKPWKPDDKNFAPLNYYGQTKLEGELAVSGLIDNFFIVRTAWVFGRGKNFIKTMINVGKTHETVRVVNDQIGTPTYSVDLARLLVDMVETEKYGYYHATNSEISLNGFVSWYDYCREFYRQFGLSTSVIPVSTEEYGQSRAARPKNSRLDKSKLVLSGFIPLPDWKDAISRYLQEDEI